ncbi:MAG: LptF/LptG family permease [Planctomycetota bacterium]|nr:LptF/LptG family permease [Planctomycetota bacterium]
MTRTLDRYVGRATAGSVLASMLFFLFLTIVIDLLNHLGNYLDRAERQGMNTVELLVFLGGYYLRRLPVSFVVIAPFATVIGCMFAIARLMAQNELQPMLFVGRSMTRVLRPVLMAGLVSALGMAACWQWVVPTIATDVVAAQNVLDGGGRLIRNVVFESRGDQFAGLRVREYDPERQRLVGVSLLRQHEGGFSVVLADAATWNQEAGDWQLENGVERTPDGEQSRTFLGAQSWTPDEILQRGQESIDCELLSYDELIETRQLRPNRKDVAMALHRHITYPLANLILLLLALPFAIHFERGGKIERVLGAVVICASYLLFDLICQNLGYNGWLHPVVAAWSPTILFGSLGVVMFTSVRS